jgi:hypothetical protein
MREKSHKVIIRFNQQQLQVLDIVSKEGIFGKTYPEIIVNLFREYIRQTFGKGGA